MAQSQRCWSHRRRACQQGLLLNIFWLTLLFPWLSSGTHGTRAADFSQQIKPLLKQRCYACHGALKQEGRLRLDTVAFMRTGGDNGTIVEPKHPDMSILIQRLRQSDPTQRMPPEGEPLSETEIRWIESWMKDGAQAPHNDQPQTDPREHWAFRPPKKSTLPNDPTPLESTESRNLNPIDLLLAVKHHQRGIQPLKLADKQTLVRRLFIDLLGIPPTPQEVGRFLNDDSRDAYEKLVEELLARPEYGERWGRHWMDIWRYSDWYGRRAVPDVMNSYPQIWRWRDWIVRSLNDDKGYDRMIMEMLAADELCPTEDDNVVATGFLVRNWYKWNYETWMKDNVEHTGKAFLGLTLNCAHCHDHKYDPVSQEDYFRFRAFFEPLELRHDRVANQADPGPFKKYVYADSYGPIQTGAIRVFDEKLDAKTFMYAAGDARNRLEGKSPVDPRPPQSLCSTDFVIEPVRLPIEATYPGLKDFVRQDELKKCATELELSRTAISDATTVVDQSLAKLDALRLQAAGSATNSNQPTLESSFAADQALILARLHAKIAFATYSLCDAKLDSLRSRIAADEAHYRNIGNSVSLDKIASRAEKKVAIASAEHAVLISEKAVVGSGFTLASSDGADASKWNAAKQESVKCEQALQSSRRILDAARTAFHTEDSNYTPLSPIYPAASTGRRLALARWIANRDNPLTARVAINHIWLRHFGQALVETTDNLGIQGKLPEHPDILDWLAVELMDHAWSIKHIHRIILNSQAYQRLSSAPLDHSNQSIDKENRSYWRANARRMEAEVVRDSVLACSGALDKTLGGPEIDPAEWFTTPRRSLYFAIHGESKMQFLDTFDGPNVCDCYRRTSTVLPQQALAMTNSELSEHFSRILAKQVSEEMIASNGGNQGNETEQRFVSEAFQRVISRQPSDSEMQFSLQFIRQQHELLTTTPVDQLRLTGIKGITPAASDVAQRARENLTISLFSHNDFVTVR